MPRLGEESFNHGRFVVGGHHDSGMAIVRGAKAITCAGYAWGIKGGIKAGVWRVAPSQHKHTTTQWSWKLPSSVCLGARMAQGAGHSPKTNDDFKPTVATPPATELARVKLRAEIWQQFTYSPSHGGKSCPKDSLVMSRVIA